MTKTEILSRALESLEFVVADLEYLARLTGDLDAPELHIEAEFLEVGIRRLIDNDQH